MRTRTLLCLAVLVGLLGVTLRAAVPVQPVDESFRDVLRFYDAMGQPAR